MTDPRDAEIADLQATLDLRHEADTRAVKRWQEATGRADALPDHADLCVWLLGEREQLREALVTIQVRAQVHSSSFAKWVDDQALAALAPASAPEDSNAVR